jgi:oxygen-independent coproporphyrinogen-3 oxidase
VEALLIEISDFYQTADDLEITLEANPNSVEVEKFSALQRAGVNRLSLGVQSLNPKDLSFLGRTHSMGDALKAIEISDKIFKRRSFDLIYTLPHQSLREWQQELQQALTLAGDHLSLYQLTIEQGTPFYLASHRGDFKVPEEEKSDAFFQWTHDFMEAQGYPAYEVSNFAKPGEECRHNLHYWHYDNYIGIGPGAHSRLTIGGEKYALRRHRSPEKWLETTTTHEKRVIKGTDLVEEFLMMGLRLKSGFSRNVFQSKVGLALEEAVAPEKLKALQEEGLIHLGDQISLTFKGLKKLNSILLFLTKN